MKRRPYRLGRRADQAAATRRRIVDATLSLHDEQGITGTSVRDVAARAGVSPATVLNHFPRMDQLIEACGQLSDQLAPMPSALALVGARDRRDRIRRLVVALFAWYEALGSGWEHLQIDRRTLPRVDEWLREVDAKHRALVVEAVGDGVDAGTAAIGTALTSFGSWQSLRDAGMTPTQAATRIAALLEASLPRPSSPTPSKGTVH